MGTVDFSGLKLKLIASIVAISGIALLRAFLTLGDSQSTIDSQHISWMVAIHLTFVVSGRLAGRDGLANLQDRVARHRRAVGICQRCAIPSKPTPDPQRRRVDID